MNFNTEIYVYDDVKLRLVKNIIERMDLSEIKDVFDSKIITDFELPYDWEDTPEIDEINYRVGNSSLIFSSDGSSQKEYKTILSGVDISGYSNFDTLSFSYKVNDSNLSEINSILLARAIP